MRGGWDLDMWIEGLLEAQRTPTKRRRTVATLDSAINIIDHYGTVMVPKKKSKVSLSHNQRRLLLNGRIGIYKYAV